MSFKHNIGGPGGTEPIRQRTDMTLVFTIYKQGYTDEQIEDGTAQCQDVTGWTFSWHMFDHYPENSVPLTNRITVTTDITITGTYNVSPALNTQRVNVPISVTNSDVDVAKYQHSLRRADSGHVTELTNGDCFVTVGPS